MNGIFISWQQLLFLAFVVVGVYVAELLLFLKKSASRKRHDGGGDESETSALREEVRALREALFALAARVDSKAVAAPAAEPESPYSQAIKLAKQGLDSSAVASGCGISRGEAELIVALYRASSRP